LLVHRLLGEEKTYEIGSKNDPNGVKYAKNEKIHPQQSIGGTRAEQVFSNLNNAETRTVGAGLVK